MKARLKTNGITLDYTKVAEPLTFVTISDDLAEAGANFCAMPELIVVWQHQWNWLVEQCQPLTREAKEAIGIQIGESQARVRFRVPKTIYGIPLRIA